MFSSNTFFALPNLVLAILVALHIFFERKLKRFEDTWSIYEVISQDAIWMIVEEDKYY